MEIHTLEEAEAALDSRDESIATLREELLARNGTISGLRKESTEWQRKFNNLVETAQANRDSYDDLNEGVMTETLAMEPVVCMTVERYEAMKNEIAAAERELDSDQIKSIPCECGVWSIGIKGEFAVCTKCGKKRGRVMIAVCDEESGQAFIADDGVFQIVVDEAASGKVVESRNMSLQPKVTFFGRTVSQADEEE